MYKYVILLTAITIWPALASAEELQTPHLVVYGTAEINVAPNEMNWLLNVRNEAKELTATAEAHTAIVKKLLEFLKSQKINEDKLQTSRMHFGENWEYNLINKYVRAGYYASTNISFTISDFDLYEKLWFGLAAIDGVSIQNIQYAHSDYLRYQNENCQKAVLSARKKATDLAKTLGSQIGEPLKIEEISVPAIQDVTYSAFAFNEDKSRAMESLAPGQLTISTHVRVVFRLKNP